MAKLVYLYTTGSHTKVDMFCRINTKTAVVYYELYWKPHRIVPSLNILQIINFIFIYYIYFMFGLSVQKSMLQNNIKKKKNARER